MEYKKDHWQCRWNILESTLEIGYDFPFLLKKIGVQIKKYKVDLHKWCD
jgi:hypothetical protein